MIISLGIFSSTSAQEVWIKDFESFNATHSGGGTTPPLITFGDHHPNSPITFGGWMHDSLWIYDAKGKYVIKKIYNVDNIIERVNGIWQIGARAPMIFTASILIAHPPPLNTYQLLSSEASPLGRVLNLVTHYYDSLRGITFDNGYFHFALAMGNNEILFLSNGHGGSFSQINGSSYRFAVILDTVKKTVRHTYNTTGEGVPGYAETAYSSNDTNYIIGRNSYGNLAVSGIKWGTSQWLESLYPTLPVSIVYVAANIHGVNYALVLTLAQQYKLVRLDKNGWVTLIDFQSSGASSPNPFKGFAKRKGKLYLATEFTTANKQAISGIITFDELTSVIANVASSPPGTINNCLGLYSIDDTTLYMPWRGGTIIPGSSKQSQTLYELRDTSLPKINLFTPTSGFTGTPVTIKGKNFTGTSIVSFGGIAASSYNVVNDSTITAVVGNGATGNVLVRKATGADSLAGFVFTCPTASIPSLNLQSDTILNSSNAPYYQWYFNNNLLNGESSNSIRVTKVGFYRVETSLNKICWTSSLDFPILVIPYKLPDTLSVEVYPNPAVGTINVHVKLQRATGVITYVTVTDGAGSIIKQTNKLIFFGDEAKIPVSLNPGMYFVKVYINGDVRTSAVLVQ